MGPLRGFVIVAVGATLQVGASAAPRPAGDNWIGTWGYVALPPLPAEPIPAAAAAPSPPAPTPQGVFVPPASPPRQIIARAHEHGVRVIGATLKHWIGTSGAFDAVIDFAPVLVDQNDPVTFDRRYNDSDHPHPNDAGHKVMGDSIDLSLILK